MRAFLWMLLAGSLGTAARYGVNLACAQWLGGRDWAFATLLVNVVGSFVLALVVSLVAQKSLAPELQLIVGTGFCGAFTTFSALALETEILARRAPFWAMIWVIANVILGLGAVLLARHLIGEGAGAS